ncbi:MAG: sialate O-acetylesterase [Saprospiraceae bacterium]|nr:sialate O-acetylesterase [Saprospiraceae bacterium]
MKQYTLFLLFFFTKTFGFSQIRLPRLISDGMVLQCEKPLKIWGWASPNETITLNFNKQTFKTKADALGKWSIPLPPQKANVNGDMVFKGKNEVKISDIVFGDVWLCSGQSNMVTPMERVKEKYPDEITGANNPKIRFFFIPTLTNLSSPQMDLPAGEWKKANPKDILTFSAVAYFFAKATYERYKIPIGLINSSVGGTPIEAWISEDGLNNFEDLTTIIQRNKDTTSTRRRSTPSVSQPKTEDIGLKERWFDPNYTPKGWRNIHIPGYWEDQGIKDLNGVVWYRREIDVPTSMTGVPAKLFMGRIIDADFTYINGVQVGNITYQYPPRRYEVPANLLKVGKNTVVIRVINTGGKGGFVPDKNYVLTANGQNIDLKGDWQYKVGEVYEPMRGFGGANFSAQNQPTALFNAMTAPVVPFPIKGVLWYQGESNAGNPAPYGSYLKALINDYRKRWQEPNLPFLYVQLPNYMEVNYSTTESQWAEMREAQRLALSVPNTGMVVTTDLGEWNDIHPLSKKPIGERLALAAQHIVYGDKTVVPSGPIFKTAIIENSKIRLKFDHIGGGLVSNDGEDLRWFSIAGWDKKFVWAKAAIQGDEIVVSSEKITTPQYVRYAWQDNPDGANLYNKEGLPASPFTTEIYDLQPDKTWKGKKTAVVLTYDDALNVHLDNAIPILDSLQLKASFYLSGAFDGCKKRLRDWRKAAQNGHELGNHTLFHPCDGSKSGRSWLTAERDMSKYSVQRMTDEIKATNILLEAIDGKNKRTFAYTCGDMTIDGKSFMDSLHNDFVAARAVRHEMHSLSEVDLYNVDCYAINGETGAQMIDLVKKSMESGKLLVFLFHGVGGEHGLNVDLQAHRELLYFLKNNEKDVWVAPMLEVAEHIRKMQAKAK